MSGPRGPEGPGRPGEDREDPTGERGAMFRRGGRGVGPNVPEREAVEVVDHPPEPRVGTVDLEELAIVVGAEVVIQGEEVDGQGHLMEEAVGLGPRLGNPANEALGPLVGRAARRGLPRAGKGPWAIVGQQDREAASKVRASMCHLVKHE